jgi:spore coat protein U-like protein
VADLRRPAGLLAALAFLFALAFWPAPAQANVGCGGTGSIAFGTNQTMTGTIDYDCTNYGSSPVTFTLCSALGPASFPGTTAQPVMTSGSSQLKFNLYTTAARTTAWTATAPISKSVTIAGGATASGTLPFYGFIPSGQSPPPTPGDYQTWFHNTVIGFLVSGTCSTNSGQLAGTQVSLTVTATYVNACTVTAGAGSKINFGVVPFTATNRSASSQISVNCPSGTVYRIGLAPSNGSSTGAGVMSGTGANVAKVPYQLRSASAAGPVWGNTATPTSTGNGVSGTGNGAARSIPVYATVASANFPPDSYTDTVTVTVNY